ncbi:MAG: hypothetical protein IPH32_17235 [Bacteroidetes bacterium]|nr:hypothetical protein [Bacteroidota bacterium]
MEKYLTEYNATEIKEIIFPTISSIANSPSKLLTRLKFKGDITETKIEIDTMESSPTFIRGTIRPVFDNPNYKSEIAINIDSVDNEKGPLMLIYVFSYIFITIGFIFAVIKSPTNIWVYIITLICCLIPIPLVKLYSFLNQRHQHQKMLKRISIKKLKR